MLVGTMDPTVDSFSDTDGVIGAAGRRGGPARDPLHQRAALAGGPAGAGGAGLRPPDAGGPPALRGQAGEGAARPGLAVQLAAGFGVLELEEPLARLGELLGQPGRGALGRRPRGDRLGGGLLGGDPGVDRLAELLVVLLGGDLEVGQRLGGAPLGGGPLLAGPGGPLGLGLRGLLGGTPRLLGLERGLLGLGAGLVRLGRGLGVRPGGLLGGGAGGVGRAGQLGSARRRCGARSPRRPRRRP